MDLLQYWLITYASLTLMLKGSKSWWTKYSLCLLNSNSHSLILPTFIGISAKSWRDWMKAWGRRTWLCTWDVITCLRTHTESFIARVQRTWRIGCKAPSLFHSKLFSQINYLTSYSLAFLLQVHCVWRGRGPGCWWSVKRMVHDHLPGDVQSHVCTVSNITWWPGHIYHQPFFSL